MPSVGGTQKVWVIAFALVLLAVSANTASANQAWVWACHDPNGRSMPVEYGTGTRAGGAVEVRNGGCAGTAADAALRLKAPTAGSWATLTFAVPAGMTATSVRVLRSTAGDGNYTLTTDGGETLETAGSGSEAAFATPAGVRAVTFRLECGACADAALDVVGVGFFADDTTPPSGGVNWNNPVNQRMELTVSASDAGAGLDRAEVAIGEAPQLTTTAPFGKCLPAPSNPPPGWACLSVDTSGLPAGIYHRTVRAYDAAGNAAVLLDRQPFEVWHPVLGSPTQTLSIGSGGVAEPQPAPNTNPNTGGVGGAQSSACRSPRLSMSLDQKPLRISKGRAVLQYGKRYRFAGRLTCVVDGKRKSAPKRTRIQLLNKVGSKTVTKPAARVADKGRIKLSLKYPVGSRTLIFRFVNADRQRAQVSIKIKVEKKKTSKR